eukprot:483750-Pelagomonas_calceolata.AAC.1
MNERVPVRYWKIVHCHSLHVETQWHHGNRHPELRICNNVIGTPEPWSSARRATARRRSPDQSLVSGLERKMPSIGGSHWEALSLMHAPNGKRITFFFLFFDWHTVQDQDTLYKAQ